MKRASLFLASGFTLLNQATVAYCEVTGQTGIPSDTSVEEWESFFSQPNATGSYAFDGYNISGPYPPTGTLSGWEATIQIANVSGEDGGSYLGTSIGIKAPRDLELPTANSSRSNESDWHICVAFWDPLDFKEGVVDDGQDDDGSCSSFLSEECIQAIQRRADQFLRWDNRTQGCGDARTVPRECEDYYSERGIENSSSFGTNLTVLDGRPLMSGRPDTGPRGPANEDESYEKAVRGIWTVMINWSGSDPESSGTDEDDMPGSSVLCLRARNITQGSDEPNAGARLGLNGISTLLIMVFTSSFLTFWV
ncbi:hypothetical protein F66182_7948 [Fusarium sp. NRRL 66182]|nr:hypothetical protein F66182_7948 [Fusarium sp. NRRL 66182]